MKIDSWLSVRHFFAPRDLHSPTLHLFHRRSYHDDVGITYFVHCRGGGGVEWGWAPCGRPCSKYVQNLDAHSTLFLHLHFPLFSGTLSSAPACSPRLQATPLSSSCFTCERFPNFPRRKHNDHRYNRHIRHIRHVHTTNNQPFPASIGYPQ